MMKTRTPDDLQRTVEKIFSSEPGLTAKQVANRLNRLVEEPVSFRVVQKLLANVLNAQDAGENAGQQENIEKTGSEKKKKEILPLKLSKRQDDESDTECDMLNSPSVATDSGKRSQRLAAQALLIAQQAEQLVQDADNHSPVFETEEKEGFTKPSDTVSEFESRITHSAKSIQLVDQQEETLQFKGEADSRIFYYAAFATMGNSKPADQATPCVPVQKQQEEQQVDVQQEQVPEVEEEEIESPFVSLTWKSEADSRLFYYSMLLPKPCPIVENEDDLVPQEANEPEVNIQQVEGEVKPVLEEMVKEVASDQVTDPKESEHTPEKEESVVTSIDTNSASVDAVEGEAIEQDTNSASVDAVEGEATAEVAGSTSAAPEPAPQGFPKPPEKAKACCTIV